MSREEYEYDYCNVQFLVFFLAGDWRRGYGRPILLVEKPFGQIPKDGIVSVSRLGAFASFFEGVYSAVLRGRGKASER